MKKYNHAFDIAFSVISLDETGEHVTEQELIKALEARLAELKANPGLIVEAVGMPFNTYIVE